MNKHAFIDRLVRLRMNKGVSSRRMSLDLDMSPSYINSIENGLSLPNMTVFFRICDYLEITPQEFFNIDAEDPTELREFMEAAKGLNDAQLDHLIAIMKDMKA